MKTSKLFMDSKRHGNYCEAMETQGTCPVVQYRVLTNGFETLTSMWCARVALGCALIRSAVAGEWAIRTGPTEGTRDLTSSCDRTARGGSCSVRTLCCPSAGLFARGAQREA